MNGIFSIVLLHSPRDTARYVAALVDVLIASS